MSALTRRRDGSWQIPLWRFLTPEGVDYAVIALGTVVALWGMTR